MLNAQTLLGCGPHVQAILNIMCFEILADIPDVFVNVYFGGALFAWPWLTK